jgi:hypothetical protein
VEYLLPQEMTTVAYPERKACREGLEVALKIKGLATQDENSSSASIRLQPLAQFMKSMPIIS